MCHELSRLTTALLAAWLLNACSSSLGGSTRAEEAAFRERTAKAEALFKERCKTAGVVIHRTVKDVEGIELTKVRQPVPWGGKEYFDPMWAEAAMAGSHRGDRYIWQFLQNEYRYEYAPDQRGDLAPPGTPRGHRQLSPTSGYRFVEYLEKDTGKRMRCHALGTSSPKSFAELMRCEPVESVSTRYALEYGDLVAPADRQLWVAGTRLKVIDKFTGEVVAQLTKFIWDPGFGASSTGRWPWQHADNFGPDRNCPSLQGHKADISRKFIDTVLIPKQGD